MCVLPACTTNEVSITYYLEGLVKPPLTHAATCLSLPWLQVGIHMHVDPSIV